MPDTADHSVHDAELTVFERKSLSLSAAAAAGLPGRFESFRMDELRVSIATADHYGFLNTVEGVNERSIEALSEALRRFPDPHHATLVATSPSQSLIERLRGKGYEQAAVRPIAYLRTDVSALAIGAEWQIREASTEEDAKLFVDLLAAGYGASNEVEALIRAEHILPTVHGFIAFLNNQPVAAAAMSLHLNGVVLGGASTLPVARGSGAQTALLAYRLQRVKASSIPLATATAAPGTPSIRNLARLGFTIFERTAWRL